MSVVPEGLSLQLNVITPEKEAEIITWLDTRNYDPWSTALSRRTQHFGYEYNYTGKSIAPGPPMVGPILDLAQYIEKVGLMKPEQCIVNEYFRDQSIAGHTDKIIFCPVIIGISLGADVVMTFERGIEKFECFLPRRSMMMITGQARYEWKHGIQKRVTYIDNLGNKITKPNNYRRISLTYRSIAK